MRVFLFEGFSLKALGFWGVWYDSVFWGGRGRTGPPFFLLTSGLGFQVLGSGLRV